NEIFAELSKNAQNYFIQKLKAINDSLNNAETLISSKKIDQNNCSSNKTTSNFILTELVQNVLKIFSKFSKKIGDRIENCGNFLQLKTDSSISNNYQLMVELCFIDNTLLNPSEDNKNVEERVKMESYMDQVSVFSTLKKKQKESFLKKINAALGNSSFINGDRISIADCAVYMILCSDQKDPLKLAKNIENWLKMLQKPVNDT
ncbi:MAG: hypothetical protein MHPSP_003830, partial [Paramarteilia canceri]